MAKKVVSVAIRKKQPIKHINKRKNLKLALRKIFNYLKSDTYMFAPLIHPIPSLGEVSCEPIKKKETKLVEDIGDYLKCDCYMYTPLILDSAGLHLGEKAESGNVMGRRRQEGETLDSSSSKYPSSSRRIVVKNKLLQKETVKHIVQQTCRTSSPPGEVLVHSEKRKIVVE